MRKALVYLLPAVALVGALLVHRPARAAGGTPRGRDLFAKHCAVCHGDAGRGDGPAAYLVYPRPRDFTRSEFRIVSTQNGVPTDDDLLQVITNGMPGSPMPPHDRLPETDRRLLVQTVRDLWREGLRARYEAEGVEASEVEAFVADDTTPGEPIDLRGAGEPTTARLARGRIVYFQACASCHGLEGRGDGQQQRLVDSLGAPAPARDFTRGVFKGGAAAEAIYMRLRAGMKGTAMPTFPEATLSSEDAWAVAHFVHSLVPPGAQQRIQQMTKTLRVAQLASIPDDDAGWAAVPAEYFAVMPLWSRDDCTTGLLVQAAADASMLAFRLQWEDASRNDSILRAQDFQDGVAIQLSDAEDPPFFGMGDASSAVTIWSWKASFQEDLGGYRDIEVVYPNINLDHYASQKDLLPGERPALDRVSAPHHDPRYLTGWGAKNPLSDPARASAVEVAAAKGQGTLTTAEAAAQTVRGRGVWDRNAWTVTLVAPRPPAFGAKPHFIAFAVWDGAHGDRNGQKAVSIWHRLVVEEN
jgi:mono/diheme cytochrome c family protein